MTKKTITITTAIGPDNAKRLAMNLDADFNSNYNGSHISFNNKHGRGIITFTFLNEGVSLMFMEVNFRCNTIFKVHFEENVPIDFMFLTSGTMSFKIEDTSIGTIERFQNVIIRYKENAAAIFEMKCDEKIQLCLIQLCPEKYIKNNTKRLDGLPQDIKDVFSQSSSSRMFYHLGNYNLKISDYIKQLKETNTKGLIKDLTITGIVNLILSAQLTEYINHEQSLSLPESLTTTDVEKIHVAVEYLHGHLHQRISVNSLAYHVNLTPVKLQIGFKMVYKKSVNNYTKEMKLQAAYNYFSNSNLNVSQVVYKVGYTSRSYFTQIFSERFGMLPSEFIKGLKKSNLN